MYIYQVFIGSSIFFLVSLKTIKTDDVRIGGGQPANIKQFPWQFLLIGFEKDKVFTCGGFLISSCYGLTAAHCFISGNPNITILGATNAIDFLKPDQELEEGSVVVYVAQAFIHPDYFSLFPFYNDIALVLFEDHILFSQRIRPIKLPFTEIEDIESYPAVVSGYGLDLGKNQKENCKSGTHVFIGQ